MLDQVHTVVETYLTLRAELEQNEDTCKSLLEELRANAAVRVDLPDIVRIDDEGNEIRLPNWQEQVVRPDLIKNYRRHVEKVSKLAQAVNFARATMLKVIEGVDR